MKTVKVVAAVILRDDRVFATQRGYGPFKDGWEFPGGKTEPGETPRQALAREILEELNTEISVGRLLRTVEHDYPEFHLSMDCYVCSILGGCLEMREHEACKWLDAATLDSVAWLPADKDILPDVRALLSEAHRDGGKAENGSI